MKRLSKAKQDQINRALKVLEEHHCYEGVQFTSASNAKDYFSLRLAHKEAEQFDVAFLTSQHQLIKCETLFKGTINSAPVFPREVAKAALMCNAAAIVLAHNHPSGLPDPSRSDKDITGVIQEALDLFDIKVLDHIVVGVQGHTYSFAEHGLI